MMITSLQECFSTNYPVELISTHPDESQRLHASCILNFKKREKGCVHCLPTLQELRSRIALLPPYTSGEKQVLPKIPSFPLGVIHENCVPDFFFGKRPCVNCKLEVKHLLTEVTTLQDARILETSRQWVALSAASHRGTVGLVGAGGVAIATIKVLGHKNEVVKRYTLYFIIGAIALFIINKSCQIFCKKKMEKNAFVARFGLQSSNL